MIDAATAHELSQNPDLIRNKNTIQHELFHTSIKYQIYNAVLQKENSITLTRYTLISIPQSVQLFVFDRIRVGGYSIIELNNGGVVITW